MTLAVLIVIAGLLIAPGPPDFAQGERGSSERASTEAARREAAKQAEALLQSALRLCASREHEPARQQLEEAMRLWVQADEPGKAAMAALQMADCYYQDLEYAAVLKCYKLALAVKPLPGLIRVNALRAVAAVYTDLYQDDLAIHYFTQALDQARAINDLPAQTLALTGLAGLYYRQGEKTQALACIGRARQLNGRRNQTEADLLYLFGQISRDEGELKKAEAAFADALAIYKDTNRGDGQGKALCALSNLALLASQKQTAFERATRAVALAEAEMKFDSSHAGMTRAKEVRWRAWLSQARAQRALGDKKAALKSYFRTIGMFEPLWMAKYLNTEASAIASREEAQAAYREYVDLLIEQGDPDEAYILVQQSKSRTVLAFTYARQVEPPSGENHPEVALRELSQAIVRLRLQLHAPGISPERRAKLQKDIEDAMYEMREQQVMAEVERYKERLYWAKMVRTDQLQKQMEQEKKTLAEFFLGENRSFVWLFARGQSYVEILPPRKQIEQDVRAYLDKLAVTPNHFNIGREVARLREQAAGLFAKLFGGLSNRIEPGQRLIIVPDGLLYYLPFETLIHNSHYLIEDHEISYDPSASMLRVWENSNDHVEDADKMDLLAVGDPLLSMGAVAMSGKDPKRALRKESLRVLRNRPRQMNAGRAADLAPLPRARDEVQYIASLFRPDRCKVFLGSQSTEAAIKREPLRRYRRLHFATHSLIDEKSPWHSAVLLAPDDEAGEDGFLEVGEISRLVLDCDLVVISACQTGRGQLLTGEGIVGLSRAFLYAGARSVVVSLWDVTDTSAGQLMKQFYQNLADGMSNVAALRQAKLKMLNSDSAARHPHYWSSFVIAGKP